ncbi:MAG: hypothetical protein OER95_15445, partial [Acidimicrobiia bacterium]|nr:hypothetical protein [Acidimicrobiia bacterium]
FDLSRLDVSRLDMSKFDRPKFDLPKFDRSRLESFDLGNRVEAFEKAMSARLDDVEERLPSPADRVFHLQRVMAETGYSMTKNATEVVVEATNAVLDQARTSTEKMAKTFRSEADAVRADVTRMVAATKATAVDVAETVTSDVARSADTVADKVEALGDEAVDYANWSKDDLYHRAQELDIAGRSSMSKDELVSAMAKHH